jgi:FO synthase
LSDDFGVLLDAGIDDWGGVSPVTADHVNPERPWPALDKLRVASEARGKVLAPRLTIYPEFATQPTRWLAPELHFPVLDRSDAEGLGRDDPGQVWPEKVTAADVVHDGAEVVLVGHRSTQWYSGANNPIPTNTPTPLLGALPKSCAVSNLVTASTNKKSLICLLLVARRFEQLPA